MLTSCQGQAVEPPFSGEAEAASQPAVEKPEIKILQWNHFVPQYDKWFDPFAESWGASQGLEVSVEHIGLTELPGTLQAAIEAGEGPTLVELIIGASSFVEDVHDLSDVNLEAQAMFGEQIETCRANSYLPATDSYYGYCAGWVPDPGNYNIALWTEVGYPDGPATWMDLVAGGTAIKNQFGVPLGIGLSPELDSEMANRAVIWSFGGSIQDEDENVVINSPEVIEAVEFIAEMYQQSMTEDVFEWNAATNNQGLIAGELSYILNSVSAYRSLQKIDPEAADNIGFVEALKGPSGEQYASSHVWSVYVIPKYVEGAELEAAKAFLLHLTTNYSQAVFNSELYNFPAFRDTAPELYREGGWLDVDPFGSRPPHKLQVLLNAENWVTHLGYPGPANPAVAEVYASNIITKMTGQVARGEKSAGEAVAEAEIEIKAIFDKWREKGFIGGGSD
ncbi:MAG: extracellular solute-binding protein [Anaerolineae bacterium]|nr:extracellular solute-binding protein [Anaerolineae bacterium]